MKNRLNWMTLFLFSTILVQAQWEKVSEIDNNNFYQVHALNNQTVLLAAERGDVYRSENGGLDFEVSSLQGYGFNSSIAFINEQTGYLGSGCYFVFDECPGNTIYKTEDNGVTWELVFRVGEGFEPGVFIDIEVPEENTVFALNDFGYLYRSIDAGENWTPIVIDSSALRGINAGQIQFFDAENGIAVISEYILGETKDRLFKTSNSGEDWTLVYETGEMNLPAINNLYFTDIDHGFMCTNFGELQTTNDGGRSWTPITIGNEGEALRKVFFPNRQTGYVSSFESATQKTRLYRSDDAGLNWSVDLELDSTFLGDFHFLDSENAYLITSFNTLYRRGGITDVSEFDLTNKIKVFPNPITDFLMIENDLLEGNFYAQVNNIAGQVLHKEKIHSGTNQIQTKGWASGIYFLQIINEVGNMVWSQKIMKK